MTHHSLLGRQLLSFRIDGVNGSGCVKHIVHHQCFAVVDHNRSVRIRVYIGRRHSLAFERRTSSRAINHVASPFPRTEFVLESPEKTAESPAIEVVIIRDKE